MALTVFCPQEKGKGPCQTPMECSGRFMCAHLQKMIDEHRNNERHDAAPSASSEEKK